MWPIGVFVFQYKWIKAEEPVDPNKTKTPVRKRRTKTLNSSFGRKTTIKVSIALHKDFKYKYMYIKTA